MKYQWKHTSFPRRLRAGDEMNRLQRLSSDRTTLIVSCAHSNPALPPGTWGGIRSCDKGSLDSDPGKQLLPGLGKGRAKGIHMGYPLQMAHLDSGVTETRGMKLERAIKPKRGWLEPISTPSHRRAGSV